MRTAHFTIFLLLTFCSALWTMGSHAQGMVRAQFGYTLDQSEEQSIETKTTRQNLDFAGGYVFSKGFTVLAQYAQEKIQETSGGTTTESNRTSYGAGLGWISRQSVGPYLTGNYYFSSQLVEVGTTYKGTGYQVDLGLRVDLQKVCLVGGLSYEAFSYTKTATGTLEPPNKEAHLTPRLGLQVEF